MKTIRLLPVITLCFLSSCFLKDGILKDCQTKNTAQIYFKNLSTTGKSYDIIFDGANVATIAPGGQSSKITITATVTHTLIFKVAGTSTFACSQSTPSIPQCQTQYYSCSF